MSARQLTLSHMANVVNKAREGEVTDPEALQPDQMRLFSYYKPGLTANNYVIEARQHISALLNGNSGTQTLDLMNTRMLDTTNTISAQEFEVIVPRFSLDPILINSYYPPDGHQDEGRILPHLVLEDPHYPWEISAGVKNNMDSKMDPQVITDPVTKKPKTIQRGLVPWIALIVFDPEDLHLPALSDMTALNIPGFTQATDVTKQNPKGIFNMNVSDYFALKSRINFEAKYRDHGVLDEKAFGELPAAVGKVDVIFPPKTLFNEIFSHSADTDDEKYGVQALRYLSHVRQINTTGVPDAGINQEGLYSIIISPRTGVYNQPKPQTQICHLVSIENVDSTLGTYMNTGTSAQSDRIGMISLFSWIYTALPPNPVNFVDTVRNLTDNQQMLRTNDTILKNLQAVSAKVQPPSLLNRLSLGYTMTRWRTSTGEETVAFNRGPLVPQPVFWPGNNAKSDLPDCSKTGQDYQILDGQTGLMDLSYSSAWQVGKLLAISDKIFSAALMRFRSAVHNSSANATRMEANKMMSKSVLFRSMGHSMALAKGLSRGNTGNPQRLTAPNFTSPESDVASMMLINIKASTQSNASSGSSPTPTSPNSGQAIYDEFNLKGANNPDWVIIHTWLAEKLSLGSIPAQYLIPEPSFCQPESLRFFHIDDFWLDCLIDGALSVANHFDRDDDLVRREIKETFNIYLRSVVPDAGFKPQIPTYGFLIRSALIKAMSDLRITVAWSAPDDRYPVCRWTKWDDETLMCLLDRQPEELASITLAQPPHQQRFSLGSAVSAQGIVTFDLRKLYTQGAPEEWPEKPIPDPTVIQSWFNRNSRCLKLKTMATDINNLLQFGKATDAQAYIDPIPNSCEFGLELNDPSYYFKIVPPPPKKDQLPTPARDRQLYVRQPPPPPSPKPKSTPSTPPIKPSSPPPITIPPKLPPTNPSSPPTTAPTPPSSQPRIQPLPTHTSTTTTTGPLPATSTLKSQFDLSVFPDYKGPPTRFPKGKYHPDDYIPTSNTHYFDLLFTIRKKPTSSNSSFKLLKLAIDIPCLATPPSTTLPSLLGSTYTGPGLRMLSNQRFVPYLYSPDAGSKAPMMHVELVPRSAREGYVLAMNDGKTREADFRLAEANVSPMLVTVPTQIDGSNLMVKREQVAVTLTEWYVTPAAPTGMPVVSTYTVVKWKTTDE